MAQDKFILLNLENPESKNLAQAISSETARKILDLLSEKSLPETTIASKLNIPLSTAHYNTQQLLKAKLIEVKGFIWSDKGKKINIYKVANKLIIIAPKNTNSSFLDKLKDIIPVALSGLVASAGIYVYQLLKSPTYNYPIQESTYLIEDSLQKAVSSGASTTTSSAFTTIVNESLRDMPSAASAPTAMEPINQTIPLITPTEPNYALWFFLGVLTLVVLYVIIQYIRYRRKH